MERSEKLTAESVGAALAMLVCWAVETCASGFMVARLWTWFVVARWSAAPALSSAQAAGLYLLTTQWLRLRNPRAQLGLWDALGRPALVLFLGWLIHRFWQ